MIPWCNAATRVAAVAVLWFVFSISAHAADAVTVGIVTASGSTVTVPVYIRDLAATPLGIDRPAGSKIQSFSIKVSYSPASAVQSVTFNRAGITASLTPTSEFKPSTSNSASLLATFHEATNPIPLTLNASAPGNLVAQLVVTLSASATPSSSIALTLDPSLTQLTDSGGTAATKETEANGHLILVDGRIDVPPLSVSLAPTSRTISAGGSANLSAVLSSAVSSHTTVALSSSNVNVATVPASVVIQAGATTANVPVSAVAVGTAQITAAIEGSTSFSNITVTGGACAAPAAPQISGPASAEIGASYAITWSAVSNATEYEVDEATDANFTNAVTQTVTGTSASYTHDAGGRYFYRVRARNRAGACNAVSAASSTISVLIDVTPDPAMRVLVVVGSTPGSFGSYFRTAVHLYNPHSVAVSGKIVFHPAGAPGSAEDPSLAFAIGPGKTQAFDDLLPAMGLGSGIGSADLIADETSPLPLALARVFNDAGAAGTTGLTQDAFSPNDALRSGSSGVLFAPEDVQRFRLNVGIRTLDEGATIGITVRDRNGLVVRSASRTFPPTYFAQLGSAAFLDGYALVGGETITIAVTNGSAFVYGSTTDNTTNDPSIQFAHGID
jgi:hypothetical protein